MKKIFTICTMLLCGISVVRAQQLFPVFGMTLGETTRQQATQMGYSSGGSYAECFDVNSWSFWDHDNDGVFEQIYITHTDALPSEWVNVGLSWSMSYNQWVALFKKSGYNIGITKEPQTATYSGRRTLQAEISATDPRSGLEFRLDFNYGNDKGEGYSTDSRNSLYSMTIVATRGSVRNARIGTAAATTASASKNTATASSAGSTTAANKPLMQSLGSLNENMRPVSVMSQGCGFSDANDNLLIPAEYYVPQTFWEKDPTRAVYNFKNGVAIVAKTISSSYTTYTYQKWGAIDQNGKEIIPIKYNLDVWGHTGFYNNDYFIFRGAYGAGGNYKKAIMLDLAGDELFSCKNDKNAKAKIEKFYQQKGKAIIDANRRAGKYDAITRQIQSAAETVAQRSEQIRLQQEEERLLAERLQEEEIRRQNSFKEYARNYVEQKINTWQVKGEYEKTSDWHRRVNETTRQQKARELTREAEMNFITEKTANLNVNYAIDGVYDADNETYCITADQFGKLLVKVPMAYAPQFRDQWSTIKKTPKYFIENDVLALAAVTFTMKDGRKFNYSNNASLNYSVANVEYNFNPLELEIADAPTSKGQQNISTKTITAGSRADVDVSIPQTNTVNQSTFVLIIANENYANAGKVDFALNDGRMFGEYCRKTLGIPEKNINIYNDATYVNIRSALNLLENLVSAYGENTNVIFYYAGHGFPDEKSNDSYLLPVDGIPADPETCYAVDGLYSRLGAMNAARVVVFMDACFSGAQRNGSTLVAARGVSLKAKQARPQGRMAVFSAAQGDETAYPYREKSHGLFTYFLLKKLQMSQGNVTLGELADYLVKNVRLEALRVNQRSQTPSIETSSEFSGDWHSVKLK